MPDGRTVPAWLPKTRVAQWRRNFYRDAYEAARKRVPDITMSDWIREACDAQAMDEMGVDEMPVPAMVYGDAKATS